MDPTIPKWAKHAVWYQIFPERFCNGDTTNDPKLVDIIGSWPHDSTSEWHLSPWNSDWYTLQPWETRDKGFYFHVQRRRYGGDLQGVINKLDYLSELGVNALYFNPLFESPSLHKYDGASYHHIDTNFGPHPELDQKRIDQEVPYDPSTWKWTSADSLFIRLIAACHKRDIRVIIDGVFNHVGLNFWAFKDVKENQQQSVFKDWFIIKSWDDPDTEEDEFVYQGWANVKELPEIREDNHGFYPQAWRYMKHAIKKWMDPNNDGDPSDGIDGWRLDVAEQVGFPAWRTFRTFVRDINPEAYIVGEVWWEDWPDKMFNASPWLQGDLFDAVKNYRWAALVQHFFIDKKNKITATEFAKKLQSLMEEYPDEVNYVLLNLMDSHDTDRLASNIVNPDFGYDAGISPQNRPDYDIRKPTMDEITIQKLILLFQMTYLGAPMIYYGDEAGMWGADDPDCRKPMIWPDINYEDERSHPFFKQRPTDEIDFNFDLFNYYKKLIHIRRNHLALQVGNIKFLLVDEKNDVMVYERSFEDQRLFIVINNSPTKQNITLQLAAVANIMKELISGKKVRLIDHQLEMDIPGKSGTILTY